MMTRLLYLHASGGYLWQAMDAITDKANKLIGNPLENEPSMVVKNILQIEITTEFYHYSHDVHALVLVDLESYYLDDAPPAG